MRRLRRIALSLRKEVRNISWRQLSYSPLSFSRSYFLNFLFRWIARSDEGWKMKGRVN
jgi:hypothetical protein